MAKAKKSLGQNFLTDQNILKKIVELTKIQNKSILEVGPGTGNLTSSLLKKNPKKIFVIEKDNDLASLLEKNFKNKITIINNDILEINENFTNIGKETFAFETLEIINKLENDDNETRGSIGQNIYGKYS